MVDGRRHDVVLHGEAANQGFHSAGCAEEVAGHGLGGADVELIGVFAEEFGDGLHFGDVADGRRRAVNVDVVDVFGLHACVFEGIAHHEVGTEAFGVGSGDVVRIGRHAHTCYFAVDLGTACLGVLEFFENEHTGAFAHNETVAAGGEGTRSVLGVVVARGEGVHSRETAHAGRPDSGFGTAGNNGISLAEANEVEGIC